MFFSQNKPHYKLQLTVFEISKFRTLRENTAENAKQLLETFSETCNWEAIQSRPNRLEVSQPKSNDYQKFDIQSGKWLNEHPVQE